LAVKESLSIKKHLEKDRKTISKYKEYH